MATVRETERQLAVVTNWSFVGAFGLCLILSGLSGSRLLLGLLGFAVIVAGFVAHLIIGNFYGAIFKNGEVIVGFLLFGVGLLVFMAAWIFDPGFDTTDVAIGLAGFATVVACFIVYVVTRFGLKGSFSMFHHMRSSNAARAAAGAEGRESLV